MTPGLGKSFKHTAYCLNCEMGTEHHRRAGREENTCLVLPHPAGVPPTQADADLRTLLLSYPCSMTDIAEWMMATTVEAQEDSAFVERVLPLQLLSAQGDHKKNLFL